MPSFSIDPGRNDAVLTRFDEQFPGRELKQISIEELNETCPNAGASTWHEAAHALHGIALSIGAIRLSQVVADTLQREKLEHAQNYVVEFARYFSEVREVLAPFLA